MPELPEVEVVRRGLDAHVVNRTITGVSVLDSRSVRRHGPGPVDFCDRLSGRTVLTASRRGKYLWLELDDGQAVLCHLGMSGQMLISSATAVAQKHLRITFELDDGCELRFVDQRIFGGMQVCEKGTEVPEPIAHIARDLLDPDFDAAEFGRRIKHRTTQVKRALLDQSLISGIGNIYADEALWSARLHFARNTKNLRIAEIARLLTAAKSVMTEALAQGGTSFDALYVNVNGESGYFDRSLNAYGQVGEPCSRCGTLIRRSQFMNRSSFWCPRCQPQPRRPTGAVR